MVSQTAVMASWGTLVWSMCWLLEGRWNHLSMQHAIFPNCYFVSCFIAIRNINSPLLHHSGSDIFPASLYCMRLFHTPTQHTVSSIGFENDRTFLAVDDVKATFIQLLWWYKTDFVQAWFYGVKMDKSNSHSLESALGLDDDEVFKVLSLFKIAYHHVDNLRICRELNYWKGDNGEREELFWD